MNVYSFPTFNLTKVLLTAEELELPYQLQLLDPSKGEHKAPEHLARHPLGKVPVVEIDGKHYFESNSICRLLAERQDNQLYANTPEARAEINQWADMAAMHIGRWLTVYFHEELIKPKFFDQPASPSALAEAKGFLDEQLPVLEQRLEKTHFICGDSLTIADIIAFSYCQTHEITSLSFDNYPNIVRWYEDIKSRPAFARAMAKAPGGDMFGWLK